MASASTTPTSTHHQRRPSSATRGPLSRPTTPLRAPSRSSLHGSTSQNAHNNSLPLDALESQFAELSDSMADLEANFMYLGLMHESLARFSESFAAFLYGLNMNAFCVDFPEAPLPQSFTRPPPTNLTQSSLQSTLHSRPAPPDTDTEATFLTTDTSFVEHPPSSKVPNKFQTPTPASRIGRGGGIPRAGGIPRGRGTGRAGGTAGGGSGIGRGRGDARGGTTGRGRGVGRARGAAR